MTDDRTRSRGWIDLDELRRRIARLAEAEADLAGIGGARVDVRVEAADGRGGPRRIVVEVTESPSVQDPDPGDN